MPPVLQRRHWPGAASGSVNPRKVACRAVRVVPACAVPVVVGMLATIGAGAAAGDGGAAHVLTRSDHDVSEPTALPAVSSATVRLFAALNDPDGGAVAQRVTAIDQLTSEPASAAKSS